MSDFLEKAAEKLAELEKQKDAISKEMATKASSEEVNSLRNSFQLVSQSIEDLKQTLEAHAQTIESLQVSDTSQEQQDVQASKALKSLRKENLMNLKQAKMLNLGFSVYDIEKMVKKAVTAPYGGLTYADPTIQYLNNAMQPTLLSLFPTKNTRGTIEYLDIDPTSIVTTVSSNSSGCFPVTDSTLPLVKNTKPITTYRNFVTVCDTHLEDYDELAPTIAELLMQGLINRVDDNIVNELNTNAVQNTTLPSYTSLAGTIENANIYDLMLIHMADMITITNGKYYPDYMILNPITAARFMAAKSPNNYLLAEKLGVNGIRIPQIYTHPLVAANRFYLISSNCGTWYSVRDASIEVAVQDGEQFRQGIVTIRGSERGTFLMTIVSSFGSIQGTISTSLANYETP